MPAPAEVSGEVGEVRLDFDFDPGAVESFVARDTRVLDEIVDADNLRLDGMRSDRGDGGEELSLFRMDVSCTCHEAHFAVKAQAKLRDKTFHDTDLTLDCHSMTVQKLAGDRRKQGMILRLPP